MDKKMSGIFNAVNTNNNFTDCVCRCRRLYKEKIGLNCTLSGYYACNLIQCNIMIKFIEGVN